MLPDKKSSPSDSPALPSPVRPATLTGMHPQPSPAPHTELTLLNSMAGNDIAAAITRQQDWGIRCLDLKDHLFGRGIADLDAEQGHALATLITAAGMRVHTASTGIGYGVVEQGETAFRATFDPQIERMCALVPILRPTQVRLLAAKTTQRALLCDAIAYLRSEHAWIINWYREAVDRLAATGVAVVIENEIGDCCVSRPQEALDLLAAIDRPQLRLIWDIVNLWQLGTYPSVAVYRQLAPVIGMVHIKGGRSEIPGGRLRWRSSLADASWPVRAIVAEILADRITPVLCLNPPHGEAHPDFTVDYAADLAFLRATFPEIQA